MDKTTIIVVEDNIVYCELVCNMLAREGYRTCLLYTSQKEKGGEKGKLGKARSTQATGACHTKCYGCADGYHP